MLGVCRRGRRGGRGRGSYLTWRLNRRVENMVENIESAAVLHCGGVCVSSSTRENKQKATPVPRAQGTPA